MSTQELIRFKTRPLQCSYLPAERSVVETRLIVGMEPDDYQNLLSRGWRRFGHSFFRHACPKCTRCQSLRVPVETFQPNRSQRRALQANAGIEVVIQPPSVTAEHLRLFEAFHEDMADRRGWSDKNVGAGTYHSSFVAGANEFGRELLYYDEGRLIGVALADILPDALSCVYFYHDPLLRKRALGVFSVLRQIQLARELGLSRVYLGYWVAECQSLAYKSQYRPHELLDWNTRDAEQPVWLPHGLK